MVRGQGIDAALHRLSGNTNKVGGAERGRARLGTVACLFSLSALPREA